MSPEGFARAGACAAHGPLPHRPDAGTTFRGQFEKRLQGVIEHASRDPRVILSWTELHNLIGAGSAMGQRWTGEQLKPALPAAPCVSSGRPRATSTTYILADAALERRFHPSTSRSWTVNNDRGAPGAPAAPGNAPRPRLTDAARAGGGVVGKPLEYRDRKHPDKEIDLPTRPARWSDPPHAWASGAARRARRGTIPPSAVEQEALDASSGSPRRGHLLERFIHRDLCAFEAVGVGRRLLTGQTTPRPVLPRPVSPPARGVRSAEGCARRTEARAGGGAPAPGGFVGDSSSTAPKSSGGRRALVSSPEGEGCWFKDRRTTSLIGGGQAGIPLAHALAGRHARRAGRAQEPGRACVNFGCTPTKAVIAPRGGATGRRGR